MTVEPVLKRNSIIAHSSATSLLGSQVYRHHTVWNPRNGYLERQPLQYLTFHSHAVTYLNLSAPDTYLP